MMPNYHGSNECGVRVVVVRAAAGAVNGIELVHRECMRHVAVIAKVEHLSCRLQHFLPSPVVEVAILRIVCYTP